MPAEKNGRLEYQAQSPDESALVSAARNFGFVFRERSPNTITIEVMGRIEEYELLCILDFNNIRKRMSVVVKRDGHLMLLCKGARRNKKGQADSKKCVMPTRKTKRGKQNDASIKKSDECQENLVTPQTEEITKRNTRRKNIATNVNKKQLKEIVRTYATESKNNILKNEEKRQKGYPISQVDETSKKSTRNAKKIGTNGDSCTSANINEDSIEILQEINLMKHGNDSPKQWLKQGKTDLGTMISAKADTKDNEMLEEKSFIRPRRVKAKAKNLKENSIATKKGLQMSKNGIEKTNKSEDKIKIFEEENIDVQTKNTPVKRTRRGKAADKKADCILQENTIAEKKPTKSKLTRGKKQNEVNELLHENENEHQVRETRTKNTRKRTEQTKKQAFEHKGTQELREESSVKKTKQNSRFITTSNDEFDHKQMETPLIMRETRRGKRNLDVIADEDIQKYENNPQTKENSKQTKNIKRKKKTQNENTEKNIQCENKESQRVALLRKNKSSKQDNEEHVSTKNCSPLEGSKKAMTISKENDDEQQTQNDVLPKKRTRNNNHTTAEESEQQTESIPQKRPTRSKAVDKSEIIRSSNRAEMKSTRNLRKAIEKYAEVVPAKITPVKTTRGKVQK